MIVEKAVLEVKLILRGGKNMIFLVRGIHCVFFSGAFFDEMERIAGGNKYDFLGQAGVEAIVK